MSCNICHTPILVDLRYLTTQVTQRDHLEPIVAQVCPQQTHQPYFRKAVQLDRRFQGVVMEDLRHTGLGMFCSMHWNIVGGVAGAVKQEEVDKGVTTNCVLSLAV